jgi:sugar phosphate permease
VLSVMNMSSATYESVVYRKVTRRLLPVLFVSYILAYIDRVNVGFAKLAMKAEPWFSEAVFATGAGVFFLGYFLFEVPGNVILHRVGARLWLARIMVGWGIVSACLAWSHSTISFYSLRFLLGIAEAGFFPGIILYLTYWYPREHRARMSALFMTAIAVAGVIGGPLSGWLLKTTEGWNGLASWQWLFILEGIPTTLLGLALPWLLTDRPEQAGWLTLEERELLRTRLAEEEIQKAEIGHAAQRVRDVFTSPRVWLCCALYFGVIVGLYGTSFWLPQIIKDNLTQDELLVGLYSAFPWAMAAIAMVLVSRSSDRHGERRWHVGISALVAGVAFAASGLPGLPPLLLLALLSIAITGVMSAIACFWALPTAMLSGTAAAAGIAWINSVGNLAGYLSPQMIGWLKVHHGMGFALSAVALILAASGFLVIYGTRSFGLKTKNPTR